HLLPRVAALMPTFTALCSVIHATDSCPSPPHLPGRISRRKCRSMLLAEVPQTHPPATFRDSSLPRGHRCLGKLGYVHVHEGVRGWMNGAGGLLNFGSFACGARIHESLSTDDR